MAIQATTAGGRSLRCYFLRDNYRMRSRFDGSFMGRHSSATDSDNQMMGDHMTRLMTRLTVLICFFVVLSGSAFGSAVCRTILGAATPLDLTDAWQDVGVEIMQEGTQTLDLKVCFDKNDSTGLQLQILKKNDSSDTYAYLTRIGTATAPTPVPFDTLRFSLTTDADQCFYLPIDIRGTSPFLKLQAKVGVVGATAGQIDSVTYCFSK